MEQNRIEPAVQRIEAALARIAVVADSPIAPQTPAPSAGPGEAALRETVAATLAELDQLIGKLER